MAAHTTRAASRSEVLRPTAVNSILAEVRQAQSDGLDLVSLMRGEPDFPTPPHIVDAAVESMRKGRTHYPDNRGELGLRTAVAAKLHRENGLDYDPVAEILVTTGATFGIYAVLTALLNEGDEVLLPEPVYDAYLSPIRLAGAVPVAVPAVRNGLRFTVDPAAFDRACTPRTRLLLLNTPWNPAGTVLRRDELLGLAEVVERRSLILASDEIYEAVVYDGNRHISPAALSPSMRARTVLINSLSKTYSMTGWRVGYCAAPADLIQPMFLVLQQSSRGPATFIQDAAAAALEGSQECVASMRAEYAARRERVITALAGLPGVRALPPEGGFFLMADIGERARDSNAARRCLLREHGVVVAHGAAYGPSGEGTLRVSFASGGENLARGLERLREGLSRL